MVYISINRDILLSTLVVYHYFFILLAFESRIRLFFKMSNSQQEVYLKYKLNNKTEQPFCLQCSCFILTYAGDIGLTLGKVVEHIQNIKHKGSGTPWFTGVICHCGPDILNSKKYEIMSDHNHFHAFLETTDGIRYKNVDAHKTFDIPLDEPYLVFIKEDGLRDYKALSKAFEEWNISSPTDPYIDEFCQLSGYKNWNIIEYAVANFLPRKNYGSVYHMIKYVWLDNTVLSARCDWDITVDERLQIEFEKLNKKDKLKESKELKAKDQKEYDFCMWLREQILSGKFTQNELLNQIYKNKDYSYIYYSKFTNYNNLIKNHFKNKPIDKPKPYWGKFWIPKELANYLNNILLPFIEKWNNDRENCVRRPPPLYLCGKGGCGKTSLMISLGTCSYWCNTWNFNNYEIQASFNLMDDYDGSEDYKGNQISGGFNLLKPWFGGQDVVSISGKYREPITVPNGKPLVFISNYSFDERFPKESDRKYLHDIGITVINLGENDLFSPKDRSTIGGFCNWVEFDTRNTWYYKNNIKPKIENFVQEIYSDQDPKDIDRSINLPRHGDLSPEVDQPIQGYDCQPDRKKRKINNEEEEIGH